LGENAVFLELGRGGYEIYHFEENGGCDFIAKREDSNKAIQVTWELGETIGSESFRD
jgi:predicted AAA+ superfamily ATPase